MKWSDAMRSGVTWSEGEVEGSEVGQATARHEAPGEREVETEIKPSEISI